MALWLLERLHRVLRHRQAALGTGHRQLRDAHDGFPQQGRYE